MAQALSFAEIEAFGWKQREEVRSAVYERYPTDHHEGYWVDIEEDGEGLIVQLSFYERYAFVDGGELADYLADYDF